MHNGHCREAKKKRIFDSATEIQCMLRCFVARRRVRQRLAVKRAFERELRLDAELEVRRRSTR